MSNKYYVYTLARPDGSVFYVGKGKRYRIRQHEQEALRGHKCAKCEEIRAIWRQGGTVQRTIIFESDDEQVVLEREVMLISLYGRGNLLNRTSGGDGGRDNLRITRSLMLKRDAVPAQRIQSEGRAILDSSVEMGQTLAARLRYLFRTRLHPEEHREYFVNEVADTLGARGARANIYNILKGTNENPTRGTLIGLARFFGVEANYFFPELDEP